MRKLPEFFSLLYILSTNKGSECVTLLKCLLTPYGFVLQNFLCEIGSWIDIYSHGCVSGKTEGLNQKISLN